MHRLVRSRFAWLAVVAAVVAVVVVGFGRHSPHDAAAATDVSADTVTVTGVGDADGAPDTLSVDYTVHVTRSAVQAALDAQSAAAHRLFASLQKAGVARKDLQTTDLQLNRHYDNNGNVTGYDAAQTVRAKIHPLSGAGRVISAGATSSGNDVEVGQLAFDISDDASLVTQARSAAFADARARAEQYAGLAGRSLGRVEKVTESVSQPDPVRYYGLAAAAGLSDKAASVPLRAGQQTLTVRVSVVWALS
jgi:uncharacterized protein YggE